MKKIFLFLFCAGSALQGLAQFNQRDSVLANERTMDRPMNVHGGQLRISGGYGYASMSDRYAADGTRIKLGEDGFAYARHRFFAEVKYGITEHLQFTALIRQESSIRRGRQVVYGGTPDIGSITILKQTTRKYGLEDLILGLDFRVPLKTRKLEILLSAGSLLPTAQSEAPRPENSLEYTEFGSRDMVYRNLEPHGNGTVVPVIGGALKYRLQNVAFTFTGSHSHALNKEVTGRDWTFTLEDDQFVYESTTHRRGIPDRLLLTGMVEFQLRPYFNLFVTGEYLKSQKGWREWRDAAIEQNNFDYLNGGAGFELIVTPRIWFREAVTMPISGTNLDNGIQFYTSLSYNLFIKQ